MCFSIAASFAVGIVLVGVGVATLLLVRRRRDLMFATVPLFFGIQQLLEGFVWLGLLGGYQGLTTGASYSYTFFSHIFWAAWIPTAVLLQERQSRRKIILRVLAGLGGAVAIAYALMLWTKGMTVGIWGHSIDYNLYAPPGWWFWTGAYILAACGSCLVSSRRWIMTLGMAMFSAAVVATIFFFQTFASVWCFLAALVSLMVYAHYRTLDHESHAAKPASRTPT